MAYSRIIKEPHQATQITFQEIYENLFCLNAARYLYYHAPTRKMKDIAQEIFLYYWGWFQQQQLPLRLDEQQAGFVLA